MTRKGAKITIKRRPNSYGCVIQKGDSFYLRVTRNGKRYDRVLIDPRDGSRPRNKSHARTVADLIVSQPQVVQRSRNEKKNLGKLYEEFKRECPESGIVSEYYKKERERIMRIVCDFFVNIDDVTKANLMLYIEDRKRDKTRFNRERGNGKINFELAQLRRLLNWAETEEKILKNPMRGFKRLPLQDRRERILTENELQKLLSILEESRFKSIRLIVLIALQCGMRFREILDLTWEHIDERNHSFVLLGHQTKGKKRRVVPMPMAIWEEINKMDRVSRFLFPSPYNSDKPRSNLICKFRTLLAAAGIHGLRFHDLRHTCASWMIRQGVDLYTVKEILGHSDIKMTQRYLTAFEAEKKKAANWLQSVAFDQDKPE